MSMLFIVFHWLSCSKCLGLECFTRTVKTSSPWCFGWYDPGVAVSLSSVAVSLSSVSVSLSSIPVHYVEVVMGIRNFLFLREIMTVLKEIVTFTF